jgi:hypothetical protein
MWNHVTALQKHNTYMNSYIHISVSDLYILMIGMPILLQKNMVGRTWKYIDRSQTHECGNWDCGRAISFLGIHKFKFLYSVKQKQWRLHVFKTHGT